MESQESELLKSWEEGIAHFNERRFWEAHEAWERGWKSLLPVPKLHIQALIQAAAAFHLLELGRAGAARSLAGQALRKFTKASPPFPRIDVPGLDSALSKVANAPPEMSASGIAGLIARFRLRAELLLSPRS